MERCRVTVLIPAHDAARFLGAALDSVFAQSYEDFEVVLVDDASTDGIDEVLALSRDPRLRVLRRSERGGTAVALNEGLKEARGRYVAVMHADDIALPRRLERQISFLERHPEVGIVGGNQQSIDVAGHPIGPATRVPTLPGHIRWMLHIHNCLNHPTVVARRGLLQDLGGYRPEAVPAEDYALWVEAIPMTGIANVDDVVLRYRIHEESASSTRGAEMDSLALASSERALRRLLHESPVVTALSVLRDPQRAESARISDVRGAASLLWRFTAAVQDESLDQDERSAIARTALGWYSHLVRATGRRRPVAAAGLAASGPTRPPRWILAEVPRVLRARRNERSHG